MRGVSVADIGHVTQELVRRDAERLGCCRPARPGAGRRPGSRGCAGPLDAQAVKQGAGVADEEWAGVAVEEGAGVADEEWAGQGGFKRVDALRESGAEDVSESGAEGRAGQGRRGRGAPMDGRLGRCGKLKGDKAGSREVKGDEASGEARGGEASGNPGSRGVKEAASGDETKGEGAGKLGFGKVEGLGLWLSLPSAPAAAWIPFLRILRPPAARPAAELGAKAGAAGDGGGGGGASGGGGGGGAAAGGGDEVGVAGRAIGAAAADGGGEEEARQGGVGVGMRPASESGGGGGGGEERQEPTRLALMRCVEALCETLCCDACGMLSSMDGHHQCRGNHARSRVGYLHSPIKTGPI